MKDEEMGEGEGEEEDKRQLEIIKHARHILNTILTPGCRRQASHAHDKTQFIRVTYRYQSLHDDIPDVQLGNNKLTNQKKTEKNGVGININLTYKGHVYNTTAKLRKHQITHSKHPVNLLDKIQDRGQQPMLGKPKTLEQTATIQPFQQPLGISTLYAIYRVHKNRVQPWEKQQHINRYKELFQEHPP